MKRQKLDPARQAYVEARAKGVSRQQSAILAGLNPDPNNAQRMEETPKVAAELARLRAEAAKNTDMTKEKVIAGILEAIDLAKVMADPQGMIAGYRELAKILGYNAPEVRKVEKRINKTDLLNALDQLDDTELLRLRNGRVVEGQITEKKLESLPDLSKE